ncbi:MAG: type VI secretion system baseplate subunit TssE [Rhodothermia bacterium]|nr:type VI secretion system baseplate subunit TssE [Rhodothermia bacterium]
MQASLLDVLLGHFDVQNPVSAVPERDHRIYSVMANLRRLFNTRQGAIEHLPDYGLPDLHTLYRDMPWGAEQLKKLLEEVVRKYEPRLSQVNISYQHTDVNQMRLIFVLRAKLDKKQIVRFQTTITATELIDVSPLRREV